MRALRFLLITALMLTSSFTLAKPLAAEASQTLAEQVFKQQAQLKVLEEKATALELASAKISIEQDRKHIEWWFAMLGALVGALTLVFGLIPVFFTLWQSKKIDREFDAAKALHADIKSMHQQAKTDVTSISQLAGSSIPDAQDTEGKKELAKRIEEVKTDANASGSEKLRAEALNATQANEFERAHQLFEMVLAQDNSYAHDHYNAGVCLSQLTKRDSKFNTSKTRQKAMTHYASCLAIKPDHHEAANNLGATLNEEACEVAKTNLSAAQALWRSAGEKYALALSIKPDKHETASNWGVALISEASAVVKNDLPAAQALWQQAETLLKKHAQAVPVEMSYNLACVYSRLGKLDGALAQLEIARTSNKLPDHWRTDDDLATLQATPNYQTWLTKHFPNG